MANLGQKSKSKVKKAQKNRVEPTKKVKISFFVFNNFSYLCTANRKKPRGVAQLVSAPALGAGGPKFESWYPDRKEEEDRRWLSVKAWPSFL